MEARTPGQASQCREEDDREDENELPPPHRHVLSVSVPVSVTETVSVSVSVSVAETVTVNVTGLYFKRARTPVTGTTNTKKWRPKFLPRRHLQRRGGTCRCSHRILVGRPR